MSRADSDRVRQEPADRVGVKPAGIRELTPRSILCGLLVAAVMGASYPYVVLKLGFVAFVIFAAIAVALGQIGVAIGGGGLAAFVGYAIYSSIAKAARLRRAMIESELD